MSLPTLKDFMTFTPSFVSADSSLAAINEVFETNTFRHLPVLMGDEVVGMVSERDVHLALSLAGPDISVEHITAADVCTPDPYTVDIETPLQEVVHTMGESKFGAAVVTGNGKLAGILTTTDVCRLCSSLLSS